MSMGSILVHLEEQPGLHSVLTTTLLRRAALRRRHIAGLHVRPGMPRLVPVAPEGAFIPATEIVEDLERADRELSRRLRDTFESFMREHEVTVGHGAAGRRAAGRRLAGGGLARHRGAGQHRAGVRPDRGRAAGRRRRDALDERARDRAVRERAADPDRAAGDPRGARQQRRDRLERQHRDRAHDRDGDAVPRAGRAGAGGERRGRHGAGAERAAGRPGPGAQPHPGAQPPRPGAGPLGRRRDPRRGRRRRAPT